VDRCDTRCIVGHFLTRAGEGFGHLVQNVEPAPVCLVHSFGEDIVAQALDLDVHLQGCDPLAGACHFKVHVAQVVFQALDVAQDGVPVVL